MSWKDRFLALFRARAAQRCQLDQRGDIVVRVALRDGFTAIAGAAVNLHGPSPDRVLTGEDGLANFPACEPGDYLVTVSLPSAMQNAYKVFPVIKNGTLEPRSLLIIEAQAEAIGTLLVQVHDESDQLVTGTTLIGVSGADDGQYTGSAGQHAFTGMATGAVTVQAQVSARYLQAHLAPVNAVIEAGQTTIVRLAAHTRPAIVSVAWLDGADDSEIGSATQFVNLPRGYADPPHVPNGDRSGRRPRIKVRFDRPGAHGFTLRLLAMDGNVAYSSDEKEHEHFTFQEADRPYTTEADGSKIIDDVFIASAGGDRYWLRASDDSGKVVESGPLAAQRLFYCIEMLMTNVEHQSSLAGAQQGFAQHHITLVPLPAVPLPHMRNIAGKDGEAAFLASALPAYNASQAPAKAPHVIAIAYVDQLPKQGTSTLTHGVTAKTMADGDCDFTLPAPESLWQPLEHGKPWFASAAIHYQDGSTEAIPASSCIALEQREKSTRVKVKLRKLKADAVKVELVVNVIKSMSAGRTFRSSNLILLSSRNWFEPNDPQEQLETLLHELGHKIGLVPDGEDGRPDRSPTLYQSISGHKGNHCHYPMPRRAAYDDAQSSEAARCIMFGESGKNRHFCTHCSLAIRKLAFHQGWTAFA